MIELIHDHEMIFPSELRKSYHGGRDMGSIL